MKAARGAQLLEKQKIEEAKQLSCNSRWSQDSGGEVYIFMIVVLFISVSIIHVRQIVELLTISSKIVIK